MPEIRPAGIAPGGAASYPCAGRLRGNGRLRASIGLAKLTGPALHTSPALAVEEFDKLSGQS